MFITILVTPAHRFRSLRPWCQRFKARCIGEYIAIFENLGKAQALIFIGERHRAEILLLELNKGSLGIFIAKCDDHSKLFKDLLPRALHRYGIYIHYPTARGYPVIIFPNLEKLNEFKGIEIPTLRSYVEPIYTTSIDPIRLKDYKIINSIIHTCSRTRTCLSILRKASLNIEDLKKAFSITI